MNNLAQTSRVLILQARCGLKCTKLRGGRFLASASNSSVGPTTSSSETHGKGEVSPTNKENPIDSLSRTYQRSGLRWNANRELLVKNFFDFSKAVLDSEASVENLLQTRTFAKLQEQIELYIDHMSNAQIVNLLASAIKLQIDPSTTLVRLLEHEVKFRLTSLTINQANKLFKFYMATELSPHQKHLTDMLSYRMRSAIQSDDFGLKELVEVLDLVAGEQLPRSYLPLIEERILIVLTANVPAKDDDDIVSKFINNKELFDYEILCHLFIKLAQNRRRPPQILRAATDQFSKVNLPKKSDAADSLTNTVIEAWSALPNFNYPNRVLISKLSGDLTKQIDLKDLDSSTMSNILRSAGALRWRHPAMMEKFFNYFYEQRCDLNRVDHRSVITLLHVTALLNFKPCIDLKEFHEGVMMGERENSLVKTSRKWLNYVWSLAAMNICDESHLNSVLCDEFSDTNLERLTYTDKIRLMNLIAIARFEFKFEDSRLRKFQQHLQTTTNKGPDMQRLSAKVEEVLGSLVEDQNCIRKDSPTPYGFTVDFEIMLNENMDLVAWDDQSLESLFSDALRGKVLSHSQNRKRCALVLVPFDETITNNLSEPVCHKHMTARLLKHVGCETIFLPEPVVNREKSSADVTNRIKTIIKSKLHGNIEP